MPQQVPAGKVLWLPRCRVSAARHRHRTWPSHPQRCGEQSCGQPQKVVETVCFAWVERKRSSWAKGFEYYNINILFIISNWKKSIKIFILNFLNYVKNFYKSFIIFGHVIEMILKVSQWSPYLTVKFSKQRIIKIKYFCLCTNNSGRKYMW